MAAITKKSSNAIHGFLPLPVLATAGAVLIELST